MRAAPTRPVPVTVLTGFLGAGKTTLLNRLLREPSLKRTAVIVNEFGSVGLDHALIEASGEDVIELSDGCLCCTVRGDLVDTLERLLDGTRAIDRLVIETTGLADPAPVLRAIMAHPTRAALMRLDGVVTVVDAVNGAATLERHAEARRQVAMADRIVAAKRDLASDAGAERAVLALNAGVPILDGATLASADLLDAGLVDGAGRIDPDRWLRDDPRSHDHARPLASGGAQGRHAHAHHAHAHHAHGHHAHGAIRSISLVHDGAVPLAAVQDLLDLAMSAHGPRLLRLKGIVRVAEHPDEPLVIHAVQTTLHPPARLPAWPTPDRRTRLVVIADGVPERHWRDLFAAFTGGARPDAPDRAALVDNPLAVPGM